jgi:hypothetical protein
MTEATSGYGQPGAFETRDFYLACFLRCAGYKLLNLRAEGRRRVFVFKDRRARIRRRYQGHEGVAAQCMTC